MFEKVLNLLRLVAGTLTSVRAVFDGYGTAAPGASGLGGRTSVQLLSLRRVPGLRTALRL